MRNPRPFDIQRFIGDRAVIVEGVEFVIDPAEYLCGQRGASLVESCALRSNSANSV